MWKEAFRKNPKLATALIPLVAGVVLLQASIDPLRRQPAIEPAKIDKLLGKELKGGTLPGEYLLGAFSGFRQVIAGLLWVRADSFFHQGNYDAILPMIRLITWLDPNWLDVYATGAWHMMYNFTDEDNRSDRRYLVPGLALLNEGIRNNPDVYDLYKEKGWDNYDKVRDFHEAAIAYRDALKHDSKADTTQVMHALGHSLERSGDIDEAIAVWKQARDSHLAMVNDKSTPAEQVYPNKTGFNTAQKNLSLLEVRKAVRAENTKVPVDADFHYKVKRTGRAKFEVSGTFNLVGALGSGFFDAGEFDADNVTVKKIGKGILADGPRDGGRLEIRLQDVGYKLIPPSEFKLEVDSNETIMQEMGSIRGGRRVRKGELFAALKSSTAMADTRLGEAGIYGFAPEDAKALGGVPIEKAIQSVNLTPFGKRSLIAVAYSLNRSGKILTDAEIDAQIAKLKTDSAKLTELAKMGLEVSQADSYASGKFSRKIDMSLNGNMYGFKKEKYELILWFNPRTAPDFIQDRFGWNGEGLTDKKYLVETTEPYPWIDHATPQRPLRMIRAVIPLTREQLIGTSEEVIAEG